MADTRENAAAGGAAAEAREREWRMSKAFARCASGLCVRVLTGAVRRPGIPIDNLGFDVTLWVD